MEKELKFGRPDSLTKKEFTYCPGCGHGIIHRLVAEVMDELDIKGRTMGVAPVGCSVFAYQFFDCDMAEAAHGRAPAVATGMKRVHPNNVVFTYQGDGDLAAIGTAEIIHAANRGEKFTTIFVNNAIYGMTGGQMAPTTMPGQKSTTTPYGRDVKDLGYPIRMNEILCTLPAVAYSARVRVDKPKEVIKAKKAIKKAFEYQIEGLGFTFVEVLSTCPTNWGMNPSESFKWVESDMVPWFKPGVYKDIKEENK
jgi:2-oxoglutarate/2-oxoacid ferredoxin oxidoreductase subunit beta